MKFPGNKKAGFVLMVDAEGEFGRIPFSPRDTLSKRIKMLASAVIGLDYSIKTLKEMIELLKKYNISATFFFVGCLFLKKEDKHLLKEYLKNRLKTRYLWGRKKLYRIIPTWGSYLEKELKNPLFELSLHNFMHESNFSENDEIIEKSLEYCQKAARFIGFEPKTCSTVSFLPLKLIE